MCTEHPELLWAGWGWFSHSAHEGQRHPPPPRAQLGLPKELLVLCRAAGLQNQPEKLLWERFCTSAPAAARRAGVHSLGLSQSCRFAWGQQRQRQGCASGSSGVGRCLWGGPLQSGGVSHPRAQLGGPGGSREWASAGGPGQAGNCKSFSVRRWAQAQASFLLPAKASAVLHTSLPPSLQHFGPWKCLM